MGSPKSKIPVEKPDYVGGAMSAFYDTRKLNPMTEAEFEQQRNAQQYLKWLKQNDPDEYSKGLKSYNKEYPTRGRKIMNKAKELLGFETKRGGGSVGYTQRWKNARKKNG